MAEKLKNMDSDDAGKRQRIATVVLVTVIILLAAVCAFFLYGNAAFGIARDSSASVTVTVDGAAYGVYPLAEDQEIRIESETGYNILEIKDGSISVTEADCENQICVHTMAVSFDGGQIVCLPHRVVITIGGGKESGIDAATN
jgi:hypothetical protein